jgi:hypothetical protein
MENEIASSNYNGNWMKAALVTGKTQSPLILERGGNIGFLDLFREVL